MTQQLQERCSEVFANTVVSDNEEVDSSILFPLQKIHMKTFPLQQQLGRRLRSVTGTMENRSSVCVCMCCYSSDTQGNGKDDTLCTTLVSGLACRHQTYGFHLGG